MSLIETPQLDEICSVVTDGTHDSPKLQEYGIPFIKGKHINTGRIDFDSCDYITPEDHAHCIKRVKPQLDDVLVANIGASIGDCARVTKDYEFSIKNVALLRPDAEKIDPCYFYQLVKSTKFQRLLDNLRSGSAQPFVSLKALRGFKVPVLKDQNKQVRLGEIANSYDNLIENNRRRIALLEESARLLYHEWFVHLRFPGHETTKIIDGVPEGWELKKVNDVLEKVKSKTKIRKDEYLDGGAYPCIDQGQSFVGGYTDNEEAVYKDGLPLIVFGDHTRALKFLNIPFARGADGTQLCKSNDERLSQEMFFWALVSIDLSNYFYARHFKFLKDQKIFLPNVSLGKRFTEFARANFVQIEKLRQQNFELTTARDILLPRLMDGRISL